MEGHSPVACFEDKSCGVSLSWKEELAKRLDLNCMDKNRCNGSCWELSSSAAAGKEHLSLFINTPSATK